MVKAAAAVLVAVALGGAATSAGAQVGELVDRTKLRVCADPSDLPFSNQAGEGFENRIAELLAAKLGVPLTYTWYPQSIGFVRNTLNAGACDVVIGIPTPNALMQNTNPYYRSSYALVQRADADPKITSLHDPALADRKIGAVARTPPVTLLAQAGLLRQLKPYQLVVDTRFDSPGRQMVEDVAAGVIDVGILWGPIAGYWATQQKVPLEVTPLTGEEKGLHLDFRLSMGLRRNEPNWKHDLNDFLAANGDAIQAILLDYGVPLLDRQGQPIPAKAPAKAKQQGRLEAVPEPAGYRLRRLPGPGAGFARGRPGGDHGRAAGADRRRRGPSDRRPAGAAQACQPPGRQRLAADAPGRHPRQRLAAERRLRRIVGRVRELVPRQSGAHHRRRPVAAAGLLLQGELLDVVERRQAGPGLWLRPCRLVSGRHRRLAGGGAAAGRRRAGADAGFPAAGGPLGGGRRRRGLRRSGQRRIHLQVWYQTG